MLKNHVAIQTFYRAFPCSHTAQMLIEKYEFCNKINHQLRLLVPEISKTLKSKTSLFSKRAMSHHKSLKECKCTANTSYNMEEKR